VSSEVVTLSDRYVLETPLASGGMATVWRARDDVLARTVAVKVLHPQLAQDHEFLQRFRREALAAARLAHPNIVAIYDTGTERDDDADRHYIVMEYCGGGTLSDLLTAEGPLEPSRAVNIVSEILGAVGYAHRSGIVHRDIKPANVLLTPDGVLKVADFGIAKAALDVGDLTTTGSILGTVSYLSPEQVNGKEPDHRSDVYSVGVMLFEMVCGRPPFVAESQIAVAMKHAREEPPSPRSLKAGIPKSLDSTILTALRKNPDERFDSAEDMRTALEKASAPSSTVAFERQVTPVRAAVGEQQREPSEARRLLPVLLLIAAAIVAAVLIPRLVTTPTERRAPIAPPQAGGQEPITIAQVRDFDPFGDGEEHGDEAPLAADEDSATSWTTEGYNASFELLSKPGVGLIFELGASHDVRRVRVTGSAGYSIQLRYSDASESTLNDFQLASEQSDAPATTTFSFDTVSASHWLVWITDLPGGAGGRASISEVRFFGP
jgi:hypothetical protein